MGKCVPYSVKVPSVAGSHSLGPSILTGAAAPPGVSGSLPSSLMVRTAFPRRLLLAVAGLVVGVGVLTSVVALVAGL